MSEDVELPHRPKVWGVNFSPTGPARCNPIDVERYAGEMERHLSAALTENKGLRASICETCGHDGSCESCGAIPTIQMPYQLCDECRNKPIDELAAKDEKIAELEKELTEARSGNVAWEDAVGGLEAHLMDRVAMRDMANPSAYLQILQADVRNVRRDTEAIRKATWARESMYCKSAEAAESSLRAVSEALKNESGDPWKCIERLRAIVEGK